MKNEKNLLNYPHGAIDIDEKDFEKYKEILAKLQIIAKKSGYKEISTASLMFSNLSSVSEASKNKIYKIKDETKNEIALSSDSSLSILRYYSSKKIVGMRKYCGNVKVFRRNKKRREFSQFCYELVDGNSVDEVDINILLVIDEILEQLGLEGMIIANDFSIWKKILSNYENYKIILFNIRRSKVPFDIINNLEINPKYVSFLQFVYNKNYNLEKIIKYCLENDLYDLLEDFKSAQERIVKLCLHNKIKYNFFDFSGSELFEGIYYKCRKLERESSPFMDGGNYSIFASNILGKNMICGGVAICIEALLGDYSLQYNTNIDNIYIKRHKEVNINDFYYFLKNVRNKLSENYFILEDSSSTQVKSAKRKAFKKGFKYFTVIGKDELLGKNITIEKIGEHKTITYSLETK